MARKVKMDPNATSCTGCGRAMWTKDVNGAGQCPDCAPPAPERVPEDRLALPIDETSGK